MMGNIYILELHTHGRWAICTRAKKESDRWSMTHWYLAMRSMTQEDIDTHWGDEAEEDTPGLWPEKLLTIYDWGCNISSSIDCS